MNQIKKGIIQENEIFGVPFRVDLIPTSNKTSRPQRKMTPTSITIHNTGNSKSGADAAANSNYVDNTSSYVSWHFTVDDKEIIQELPINEIAWHAGDGGSGKGNNTSVAIEICEHKGINFQLAKENACKLITLLESEETTIKAMYPHKHWSGKYCPHLILDEGWDKFVSLKEDVKAEVLGLKSVDVDRGKKIKAEKPTIKQAQERLNDALGSRLKRKLVIDNLPGPLTRAAARMCPLKRGSKNAAVGWIQKVLAYYGLYTGSIDNSFGPLTEKAVIQFQKKFKLQVDGSVWVETWGKMFDLMK